MNSYSLSLHRHHFAVWTAARAVARGFAGTKTVYDAIEASGLRAFAEHPDCVTQKAFDEWHLGCCHSILQKLTKTVSTASFGQAAKIVAVYLKTSVVLNEHPQYDAVRDLIHPPVDRILLQELSKTPALKALKAKSWTKLEAAQYEEIMNLIRSTNRKFNWELEKDWKFLEEPSI